MGIQIDAYGMHIYYHILLAFYSKHLLGLNHEHTQTNPTSFNSFIITTLEKTFTDLSWGLCHDV